MPHEYGRVFVNSWFYSWMVSAELSGAKAACSVHGSAPRSRNGVRFSRLPRTEAGIYPAESAERVVPLSVKTLIFYH